PLWYLVLAGAMAQAGVLVGAALAPRLRQATDESRIMAGSLVVTAVSALICGYIGGLAAAGLMSFVLGVTSGTSKQAFDALVQRDAPDANRGRLFARFETRFQLAWVIGAFMPVLVRFSDALGYLLIAAMVIVAFISYLAGQRRVAHGTYAWDSPSRKLIRFGLRRVDASLAGPGEAPPEPDVAPVDRPPPPGRVVDETRVHDDGWEPPPGFVSHPLMAEHGAEDQDQTIVEQPTLPFEFRGPDAPEPGEDNTLFAEPRWRAPDA
ncbi:MAG TPA: hypothetical protein VIJ47_08400, partial [Acidimicrobiales bacterium]